MNIEAKTTDFSAKLQAAADLFGVALRMRFEIVRGRSPETLGLSEFDCDKTMRLLDKLLEAQEALVDDGRPHALPVSRDYRDKHGMRLAFTTMDGRPGRPVLNVMRALDKRGPAARRIFTEFTDTDGFVRLQPQTSPSRLIPWIERGVLTATDMEDAEVFGGAMGVLEESEVEALGRHESADEAVASIVFEFEHWREATVELLKLGRDANIDLDKIGLQAWRSWSYAFEALRKVSSRIEAAYFAMEDRGRYASARDRLAKSLCGTKYEDALRTAQLEDRAIWDDSRVKLLGFPTYCCWNASSYLCGTLRSVPALKNTRVFGEFRAFPVDRVEAARKCLSLLASLSPPGPAYIDRGWMEAREREALEIQSNLISGKLLIEGKISIADFLKAASDDVERIFCHIDPYLEEVEEA